MKLKERQPNGSGESPIFFDEGIVQEILLYSPVKSLIRFRCVCKSWNSLISEPSFVKLHLQRTTSNDVFARVQIIPKDHLEGLDVDMSFSLPSFLVHPLHLTKEDLNLTTTVKYSIIGSCNGLICLYDYHSRERGVYFMNMATKLRSEKSPALPFPDNFDIESFSLGFGYDSSDDTYKVAFVSIGLDTNEWLKKTWVQVYTMGDSCWKYIPNFPNLQYLDIEDGVYVNGTINWIVMQNADDDDYMDYDSKIISFDLGKETCKFLSLPDEDEDEDETTLGVLRDSLCSWKKYHNTHFVLWQMKELGNDSSWTRMMSLNYHHLQINPLNWGFSTLLPVCMSKDGNVLMLTTAGPEWMAVLYNPEHDILVRHTIPYDLNMSLLSPKIFTESLVMPC